VYVVRLSGRDGMQVSSRRLTNAAPEAQLPAVRDTLITYDSPYGPVTAYLIRPAGAQGPLPTIVYGYPGAVSPTRTAYRIEHSPADNIDVNAAVARGFVFAHVFMPMLPDGNYGKDGPVTSIVEGMQAAVAVIARTGWVDTTRMGIVGHSYGGYMVNTLITSLPNRFQAAVSMSGPFDLVSGVNGGTEYGEEWFSPGQGHMGVSFGENPERYLANSPARNIAKVKTPLLLLHGEEDPIVSVTQSEEFFRGLAQLGKPAELVRFAHADHMPTDAWWTRALDWFDTFLKTQ
jgi:dipeptidyl aminopeptidase/acylaminoacyl peptidase